ncbi:MAG: NADH-quinone oxidoreductase subunit NuoK [SAR202 cluster bacterium]|nr:NADH-quinone oxidoreductase subunit NuoK [SAR202 cluster bacterium]|tara:strand:+ start:3830 stop:4138 length:309 start_codon:yes stop_codon:yes gene_type:complete
MLELQHVLILSASLMALGVYGVLARRNAILILMSIELILTAVNLNLLAFAYFVPSNNLTGQIFALFVITIAAAEIGLAMAIILRVFKNRGTSQINELNTLRN